MLQLKFIIIGLITAAGLTNVKAGFPFHVSKDDPTNTGSSQGDKLKSPRVRGQGSSSGGGSGSSDNGDSEPVTRDFDDNSDGLSSSVPQPKQVTIISGLGTSSNSWSSSSVPQPKEITVISGLGTSSNGGSSSSGPQPRQVTIVSGLGTSSISTPNDKRRVPGSGPSPRDVPDPNAICDTMPPGADQIPFYCYDQRKLNSYCLDTFGTGDSDQPYGIKHYFLDTLVKASWYQALQLCQNRNMSLATVESYIEQKALSALLNRSGTIQNAWLSGNDLGQPGNYMWMSTGKPVRWTNWYYEEPNHHKVGVEVEHCVETVYDYLWRWNDNICSNQEFFICQYYSNY